MCLETKKKSYIFLKIFESINKCEGYTMFIERMSQRLSDISVLIQKYRLNTVLIKITKGFSRKIDNTTANFIKRGKYLDKAKTVLNE